MESEPLPRKLAAILYADVAGYSRLTGEDEDTTHRRLAEYLDQIATTIERHGGRVMHYAGDAVLAMFEAVVDAVSCAAHIQNDLETRNENLPDERKVQFRIGVNLGDVIEDRDDIYGDGVNVAARLESLAEPGSICISESVHTAVSSKLPFDYAFMGEQVVKNIAKPVKAYHARLKLGAVLPEPRGVPRKGKPRHRLIIAAAVVVLVVVGGVLTWLKPWEPREETASIERMAFALPDKPSIAVLPFTNMSGDPKQEYFADGMTDDLITDLSKLSELFVIARNSTFTYKGRAVKIRQVAEELGVRYVLEGSVRRAEGKIRVNAQLIDASTGGHLWVERYDRDYTDIFALQDEVIGKIVSALEIKLTGSDEARLGSAPTSNLEAYENYLRAEQASHSYGWLELGSALGLYAKAIELDPDFAEAHAGYARMAVEFLRQWEAFQTLPADVARERAYESVTLALALDPNLPKAHSTLGVLHMIGRDFEEAIESARKAVALDPNNASAYATLALVLTYAGRPGEAVPAMAAALRLEPKPPLDFLYIWGRVLFMNRENERALDVLQEARSVRARSWIGNIRLFLAMTQVELGQLEEAKETLQMILRSPISGWVNLRFLRLLWAHHKRESDLARQLDALRKAGVPEWPNGFEPGTDNRLDAPALKSLVFGQRWFGRSQARYDTFSLKADRDGMVLYRIFGLDWEGKASVDGDMLCYHLPGVLMGRKFCGYVYRNPDGTPEERNEYIAVDIFDVHHFSLAPNQ